MIRIPGKIPIIIHPLFWLLAIFIGWMSTFTLTGTLLAVLVIVISVLFHEFGHALTGMAFQQTVRIELAAFGGFTYRQGRKLKLWEEFIVVLNGPMAGLSLGVLAWLCWHFLAIENAALLFVMKFTALVNFFWTVINLVPVLPLDGGHLLSIILEGIFGFKGVKMAIASSAPPENIDLIANGLGIKGCFQAIVWGREVTEGKPSPQGFLLAAQRLGVEPASCVVIEDAIAGVAAAKGAGMKCVAVTNTHPAAKLAEAECVVDTLEAVSVDDLAGLFQNREKV